MTTQAGCPPNPHSQCVSEESLDFLSGRFRTRPLGIPLPPRAWDFRRPLRDGNPGGKKKMKKQAHQEQTRNGADPAPTNRDPATLWPDQDTSDEELLEADPLEEPEDLLTMANEATGDFIERLQLNPPLPWTQKRQLEELKSELRAKHGRETPADFIKRITGSQ